MSFALSAKSIKTTDLDVFTMEPLSEFPSDELVIMEDGKSIELVGKAYLLGIF
jgi:hypothetical protein